MSTAVYLYIAVILIATLFARLAMSVKVRAGRWDLTIHGGTDKELSAFFVGCSFLTLTLFASLSTSGTDYSNYQRWFQESATMSWREIFGQEWGYYLFNRVVHIFTSDFRVFNVVYTVVVLLLVYFALSYFSDKVNFAWAVFIFAALFYLPMFNIKRICLAAAIIFFAARFLMQKKYIPYIIAFVLAIGVHSSAIFWILFLISYVFIRERTYRKHLFLVILCYAVLIGLLIVTRNYWTTFELSSRYEQYSNEFSGIGIGVFIKYGVLLFFLIRWYIVSTRYAPDIWREQDQINFWRMIFISTCVSTVFAFAGYVNQVFSRMQSYAMYSFVLFIPYLINLWKRRCFHTGPLRQEIVASEIILVVYLIYLFFDYTSTQMISSGLGTYTTLWGLSIGH